MGKIQDHPLIVGAGLAATLLTICTGLAWVGQISMRLGILLGSILGIAIFAFWIYRLLGDSLSARQKLQVFVVGLFPLAIASGGSYWLAIVRDAKEESEPEYTTVYGLRFGANASSFDHLPALNKAEICDVGMVDFAKLRFDFNKNTATKTSLHKPSFIEPYNGKRFTWTGFVSDVSLESGGAEETKLYCVRLRAKRERNSFTVECFFVNDELAITGLRVDQEITVAGVMTGGDSLAKCKIVGVGSSPETVKAKN
jgi:hypothetical protein